MYQQRYSNVCCNINVSYVDLELQIVSKIFHYVFMQIPKTYLSSLYIFLPNIVLHHVC